MSKYCCTFILFLFSNICFTQNQNSIWCFGDSAKIVFDTTGNVSLLTSSIVSRGTATSIADSNGTLLFYTNTRAGQASAYTGQVWAANDSLMYNGDSIAGRGWYKQHVIIPAPSGNGLYYLVNAAVTAPSGLYYGIIDMTQDSGRGAVVQKNVQLKGPNFYSNDGLAAIKHGNGRDWWVIVRDWQYKNDLFYFYRIDSAGIALSHTQSIGDSSRPSFFRIEPSMDGNLISCIDANGEMVLYNFDRCSGMLSNSIYIEHNHVIPNYAPWYWDSELSANKRYLYVSEIYSDYDTTNYLLRFDLQAPNIAASRDTLYAGENSAVAGLIELAPDGKMYWSCAYNPPNGFNYPYPDSVHNYITDNLSVINYPDSSFCDFQPFSFYLGGKRTYYGLPNNPNYSLGRLLGSPCDTLQWTNLTPALSKGEGVMQITYISDWEKLFVNASGLKGKNVTVSIYDGRGSLKFEVISLKSNAGYFTLDVDCSGWSDGLYVVQLQTDKERLSKKFVKE
ncbi:MAG TPA: T9SS type A sorting domain-containing protein [Bacteroidia bacterium]|nr:T9SS type A sorting domain-containing protein [Bacteroidia bacterium]